MSKNNIKLKEENNINDVKSGNKETSENLKTTVETIEKNNSNNKTSKNTIPKEIVKEIPKTEFRPVEDYSVAKNKSKNSKTNKIFAFSLLAIIILLIILFLGFTYFNYKNTNIVSGISIKNVDISGLSKKQAKEKIQNYINEKLPENIGLIHNDFETSIPLSALNINFDIDSSIEEAYNIGKSGNILQNSLSAIKVYFSNIDIEPTFSLDDNQLNTMLDDISSKLPDTVIESSYYIDGKNLVITKGSEGNIVNTNLMATYIKNGILNLNLKNRNLEISTLTKQPSKIDIEKIHKEIYKECKNAYYTQNPFAVYPSENGLDFAISMDDAKNILEEENKDEYIIPLKILYPSVTTNMIGTEAFPDLLSTYSTKYSARNTGRTTNLQLAASKINGTVLMPGETFSYNQVVGARTIAAGYKEAPIYVSGQVVDGLGGGICQITSTLYNAVLYANLQIVERSNHQFVPSYVTASRDATVVYGSIDFKFKNNREYPIKLVCSVSGGLATFQIFGLKSDNEYDVEIYSRVTGRTQTAIYSEAYKILSKTVSSC
ncbi:MAG: VanW family protein [Clostridia bacterium]